MARLHGILLGPAVLALTSLAFAQSSTGSASTAGPAASGNPANSAATDPYVQRREARREAKAEYKDKKKAAKQEYKEEKKDANALLKDSGAHPNAGNATYPSSGK